MYRETFENSRFGFKASTLSAYDFSTLYTMLPHHLIKDKLLDLIEPTFSQEKTLYLVCNDQRAFFTSDVYKKYKLWSFQKVCEALVCLLDNIFIKFGNKLYLLLLVLAVRIYTLAHLLC